MKTISSAKAIFNRIYFLMTRTQIWRHMNMIPDFLIIIIFYSVKIPYCLNLWPFNIESKCQYIYSALFPFIHSLFPFIHSLFPFILSYSPLFLVIPLYSLVILLNSLVILLYSLVILLYSRVIPLYSSVILSVT